MNFAIALKLGRVSNLPTVWTNALAGIILAGGVLTDVRLGAILISLSLFYIGGMFLNDAFDAEIDAKERPERPIPSGLVSLRSVFIWGYAMMAAGVGILGWIGLSFEGGTGFWPVLSGLALAFFIVLYNYNHKGNPLSPFVMGMCRVLTYVTAATCFVVPPPSPVFIGAGLLLAYLIGLTYTAKQENFGKVENLWPLLFLGAPVIFGALNAMGNIVLLPFWLLLTVWVMVALFFVKRRGPGDIPRAVVSLIAGISLIDAVLIANAGQPIWALAAVAGFALTLFLQKFISGT